MDQRAMGKESRSKRVADTLLALFAGLVGFCFAYIVALVPCFDGVSGPYCNVHGYAPAIGGLLALVGAVVVFTWVRRMLRSSNEDAPAA